MMVLQCSTATPIIFQLSRIIDSWAAHWQAQAFYILDSVAI